jgi:hypothetical protein
VPDAVARALDLVSEDFTSPARRELFRLSSGSPAASGADLAEDLSPDARSLLSELSVGLQPPPEDEAAARVQEIFSRLKVFRLERDIKSRRNVLQDINPQDDAKRYDDLFIELVALEAERRDLLRELEGAA